MPTDISHKAQAQERKARRVVSVVGALSRQVAGDMDGDYVDNVRRNQETWVAMLDGTCGNDLREEAWVKLYDRSGINESVTGVNPSVEVRGMVLDILRQDLEIERQALKVAK